MHDKWGVSWQIAAEGLVEMTDSANGEAAARAMDAMLEMKKIDIAAMKKAFEGK
jgi:predicted 3-demethylubiquinone-9 3-methyltransferase (glyoxalase superfamily)